MTSHRIRRRSPGSSLPPLYAGWMEELLPGPIPPEHDTTCGDCPMLAAEGAKDRSGLFFLPETKCCTYVPTIPNFLVGRILDEEQADRVPARETIETRIARRIGVTPLGLAPSPVFSVLYREGRPRVFGRSRRLRCPHYLDGRCGIWAHRNGVCATWFCKHVRGAVGNGFWRALDQLLARSERLLATWCLLEMGVERDVLHRLFPPGTDRGGMPASLDGAQIDEVVPEEAYREAWGQWAGREGDLYREAARLVAGLRWAGVAALDAEIRLYAVQIQSRYRTLVSRALPRRVGLGSFRVLPGGTGRVRLVGYSGLHPLEVPAELMEALPYFDGRPVGQTLRRLRIEKRLTLERDLVRKLLDFDILTATS